MTKYAILLLALAACAPEPPPSPLDVPRVYTPDVLAAMDDEQVERLFWAVRRDRGSYHPEDRASIALEYARRSAPPGG